MDICWNNLSFAEIIRAVIHVFTRNSYVMNLTIVLHEKMKNSVKIMSFCTWEYASHIV